MNRVLLFLLLLLAVPVLGQRTVTLSALRTENLADPQGITKPAPRLSWTMSSDRRGLRQAGYRILVASTAEKLSQDEGDLWDSGEVSGDQSQWVPYGGSPLTSRQVCYWKVRIRSQDGVTSAWSAPARWDMGLMQASDWTAQWIGLDSAFAWDAPTAVNTRLSARYFRKQAHLPKTIRHATAYVSGLGLYELSLNGRKVGDAVLAPGPTEYDKRVLYNTYDVTGLLQTGLNAVGVTLGNGRYFAMRVNQPSVPAMTHYGYPKLRLQIEVVYTDGTTDRIVSDGSWKMTADGPIRANNEFDGEEYDATRELKNSSGTAWDQPGFDDQSWLNARLVAEPAGRLESQINPPIRVVETLRPVSVKEVSAGRFIVDMGQNMVGWVRLRVQGARGTKVTMRFAETLKESGTLYIDNLRSARATDIYILKGEGEELWEPRFTYHGFRYVELTGFPGTLTTAGVEGRVVHDDLPQAGTLTTSSDLLNQIYKSAFWSVRGNYRGIPTDCPQRDERMGWLGDRTVVAAGESYLFANHALYAKWLDDIENAQKDDGSLPDVAPSYWKKYTGNMTWPAAYVFVANMLYEQFGDDEPIRKHYESMKKWLSYAGSKFVNSSGIYWKDEYGDWAVPPESPSLVHTQDPARKTDGGLLGTAYYYSVLKLMERFAGVVGNETDRTAFSSRAETVRNAFNQAYLKRDQLQYGNNTTTANLLALACGLVPDDLYRGVFRQMTGRMEGEYKSHISTGIIGTSWLMRNLTANGRGDLAYRLATNTDYPSWGYMMRNGATTLWELWNGNTASASMNSGNHVMQLGDLLQWYYENLAGIRSGGPGFRTVEMRPYPSGDLTRVAATFASVYGLTGSEWTKTAREFRWKVTVPGNATATVFIPARDAAEVLEGSSSAANAEGVTFLRMEGDRAVFQVGSGQYSFFSTLPDTTNRPPTAPGYNPPPAKVGTPYSYTLAPFTDPENRPITYAYGGTVPGMTFDTTSRVMSGTPTQTGTYSFTVTATDDKGLSATAVLTFAVTTGSTQPIASYEGFLDAVRCDNDIWGWVWDRNQPNLALTVEILDSTVVIGTVRADLFRPDLLTAKKGDGEHGYSFLTPASLKDGKPHSIIVRVKGAGYQLKSTPKVVTCAVTPPPPVNQPPAAPAVSPLSATVGTAFSTTLAAFTDPNNDALTYTLSTPPSGLTFNATTRVLSGTPTASGSFSLTYTANDGQASANTSVSITVSPQPPVNQPPAAPATAPLSATVNAAFSATLPAFTDADNDVLTYSLAGLPAGLTFNATTRALSGTPTQAGSFTLTYKASDGKAHEVSATVSLAVSPAAPVVTGNFEGYLEGANCGSLWGWVWNRDKGNTAYTVEFLDGATVASAVVVGTVEANVFRQDLKNAGKGNGAHGYTFLTPESLKDNRSHTLWARVAGSTYVLKYAPKTITCAGTSTPPPVNAPPVAPAVPALSATVGTVFTTTLAAFTDANNDVLTYSLAGLSAGLTFNATTRVLSGTPTAAGSFTLTYAASDGKATASTPISLSVAAAPTKPASYEGFFDKLDCSGGQGWVWDRNQPNTPLTVELLEGTTLITTFEANVFRQDLKDKGKGNGQHGISFALPVSLKDNRPHALSLRVQGSAFLLKNSPRPVTCPSAARLSAPPSSEVEISGDLTPAPNPTSGRTRVRFRLAENEPATLSVTDVLGHILHQRPIRGTGQTQEEVVELGGYSPGIHYIRLQTGQQSRTGRVLLHR
ncbi:family 78 glycoside hydrolase catalytic domain [Larkinella soli]|uniref:family 78 glycoside hydrolase catalytic domain n=1 Tax=Larkinella soli TaxID=1770527 RepID=UPI000FFB23AA|nr:family 78 glycoside hydrolase catalytic domain [Larkinella soli]